MKYQIEPDYWSHHKRIEFVKRYLEKYPAPRVLDLACGTGILMAFPLAEIGYDVTGVDIDNRSITAARVEQDGQFPNLRFVCSDLNTFQPEEKFDVIVAGYIMEHLEHPDELLVSISRLLKPGGVALITIPNGYGLHEFEQSIYYTLFEPWDFIYKFRAVGHVFTWFGSKLLSDGKYPWPRYKPPLERPEMTVNLECGHAVHLTQRSFREMCGKTGLSIIECVPGALLHGQITGHIGCKFRSACLVNTEIVEYLPLWMAANWFYAVKKKEALP